MRRALGEYRIAGIRTTVPFFTWLFEQPEFAAGRFHTAFLDDALDSRRGRPFSEASSEAQEVAAISTALQAVLSPSSVGAAAGTPQDDGPPKRWRAQGRSEALR
jgi:acetyl/propionyl-CoA carboxylase alpha subunit